MSEPTHRPWGQPRMRPDRDIHAAALRGRFRAISQRYFKQWKRWGDEVVSRRDLARYAAYFVCLSIGSFAIFTAFANSPWPMMTTLKHFAAARNCDAARAVGLAPAYRGEPGYYARHDRDRDGIACEPYRPYAGETR